MQEGVKLKAHGAVIDVELGHLVPCVTDWDGDGLRDLLVGQQSNIVMYKNVGTQWAPRLQSPILIKPMEGDFPVRPAPYVIDWDGDGKKDLLVGTENSGVYFYRNTGTSEKPELAEGEVLNLKGPAADDMHRWRIDVTDWNNDGKRDILVGNIYKAKEGGSPGGNIWLFLGE
jgi:hypothetical protein